jgi:hypothetical protein
MEHTTVGNTKKSKVEQGQKSPQPLEQGAVAHSLMMIETKYSNATALVLALTLLKCMASQMLSPDALYIAMAIAKQQRLHHIDKADWDDTIDKIAIYLHQTSKGNPIAGMF